MVLTRRSSSILRHDALTESGGASSRGDVADVALVQRSAWAARLVVVVVNVTWVVVILYPFYRRVVGY